ncbi:MAG: T9SS type A sorting domain-containing protein [Flavobacteriales bacterium]
MKKHYLFAFGICLLFFSTKAQILGYTGFENYSDETGYTKNSWISDGFNVPWVNGFDAGRGYVDNAFAQSGNNSLRIKYPVNTYGPSNNGAQAPLTVTPADELYMSYWVRFSDNFDWGGSSEGGKLPGLGGGARCSGCQTCTGSNGFTARLMWRTGGKAVLYLYHLDKTNPPCGDNLTLQLSGSDFYFQKGQWYNIIERVKINSGANHDGEVELWINEQPALLVTGIQFVSNGDKVDNLYFSTFHGGSDANWAPSVECYTWFDEMKIAAKADDVFTTTALQKLHLNKEVSAYPNPVEAGGKLQVSVNATSYVAEWSDLTGKVLSSSNNSDNSLSVPDLAAGTYLLKITSREQVLFKKIIIE